MDHRMQLLKPLTLLLVVPVLVVMAGCQTEAEAPETMPIFGNAAVDNSRVLARVNGEPITENMLELRYEELDRPDQLRYEGPEGRRLFLRRMVDEMLRVREAEQRKLHQVPAVARVIQAMRRDILDRALSNDLIEGLEPDIDAVREYYTANRDQYVRLGIMHASHVECLTREEAEHAYRLLTVEKQPLHRVVMEHSRNEQTKANGGSLGHFNKGGFIPNVTGGKEFSERVWDLEAGANPPFEFRGRWHVVFVHDRVYERPQTLEEAYGRVVMDMTPGFRQSIVDGWLREARAGAEIQYFGEYRPGHGKSPRELLERAFYLKDPMQQLDMLDMLADDYPDSDLADDAIFMAANIVLDNWSDVRKAQIYLSELIRRYPDSDYVEDSRYILENMSKPDFLQPRSIEDLRPGR
jgi:hypothetical protein